ncbi:hypothetical protein CMK11_02990 [Candidatus Poribacteria bacterium]|nr:hypothetical protein [Candidatus Poribacteria bacterium]
MRAIFQWRSARELITIVENSCRRIGHRRRTRVAGIEFFGLVLLAAAVSFFAAGIWAIPAAQRFAAMCVVMGLVTLVVLVVAALVWWRPAHALAQRVEDLAADNAAVKELAAWTRAEIDELHEFIAALSDELTTQDGIRDLASDSLRENDDGGMTPLDRITRVFDGDTVHWRTLGGVARDAQLDHHTVANTISAHPETFVQSRMKLFGSELVTSVHHIPDHTGVYLVRGREGAVRYVGRSANLRRRLHQRLREGKVVGQETIQTVVTEDELQARALERELIERYAPRRNRIEALVAHMSTPHRPIDTPDSDL